MSDTGCTYLIKNKDAVIGSFEWDEAGSVKLVKNFTLPDFISRDHHK